MTTSTRYVRELLILLALFTLIGSTAVAAFAKALDGFSDYATK